MIRSASQLPPMPTGHYHLQFANMSSLCSGGRRLTFVPETLFTDGTMSMVYEESFAMVQYECIDRVVTEGGMSDIVALVCEGDLHVTIPKCCHLGEVFSHEEGECVSSRMSKFSIRELYGESEVGHSSLQMPSIQPQKH